MSTKIYNAYKLPQKDLLEILSYLKKNCKQRIIDQMASQFADMHKPIDRWLKNNIDAQNTVFLFPYGKDVLLLASGVQVEKILEEETGKEVLHPEFRRVVDFHYHNSDRPTYICEAEWEYREKVWKEVMPTMIPRYDGLVVELTNPKDMCDCFSLSLDE